ncbi:MAG: hypothetical protein ABIH50_05710 [bacterium]
MKRILLILALLATCHCSLATILYADQTYPQIDISGFKKWENKKVEVDPMKNYFAGLTQLGGYYPTFSGSPWQERMTLKIAGQLSKNLSVSYDLEQQPETPEKFDVKVKYDNTELTFGDFTANFSGNEFVSASKYMNGVMLTSKDTWYDVVAVPSAKLKSQNQALTSQNGNNTKGPYNLGHGSIVEGSEQVQLNGIFLKRNVHYTIDYFEGKITFNQILSASDEFKYTYDYTNIIDLFFPTLSKRDFFGFQSRFTLDPEKFGVKPPGEEPSMATGRDVFPTNSAQAGGIPEGESSGNFQLRNIPIVRFSETLSFMGVQLKKNEDYMIRYDSGEIKLLTRFLPTAAEPLTVEYKYFQVSTEVETIPGIGSRGPYKTRVHRIIPESEKIELDGKVLIRNLDYSIDYGTGDILFGVVVGPTSQIKVSYRHNVMSLPAAPPTPFPKELKLGVTYLKESAKKSAGAPTATAIEAYSGTSIVNNGYVLSLKNRPVVTSESFTLRTKTRVLTLDVDYTFPTTEVDPVTGFVKVTPNVPLSYITDKTDLSDGVRTGTIAFLTALSASDEVTVTYTYNKSVVGKYNAAGTGSKGPYYLRNTRDIVPGTEAVQVWDQGSSIITTYTRNTSFEANAGDTGYSINYSTDNAYITFNNPLPTSKNFQVIFQYLPSTTGNNNNDISQSAFGFDGSFKIGDIFKIDSSYAKTENDQVFVAESTFETFGVGGTYPINNTKNYALHSSANLVEGSEKISINNQVLNRDIDYYISYTAPGSFSFYYITPGTLDAISVEYKFQSTAGSQSTQTTKTDTAFRLGAETKLFGDVLKLSGNTKKIGFDFSPLGGTSIGVGSEYQEYNVFFHPDYHSFFSDYSYKYNQSPIGTTRKTFLRTYDNTWSGGINPRGLVKLDLAYRTLATIDDPLTPGGLHNSDSLQDSYSISATPKDITRGQLVFSQKYDLKKTSSKNDVIDQAANKSTSTTDYFHAFGNAKVTDRFSLGYDYQYNEPITLSSLETETAHTISLDHSYNLNLDLTTLFLKKWALRMALQTHEDQKIVPAMTSVKTRNETYHMDITPFTILTSSIDHNRQERTSYVVGGENPLSMRTAASARLSPVPWFSIGANASVNETIPETGAINRADGRSKAGDIDFTPISLNLLKLNSRFVGSDTRQTAPSGTERISTFTNTVSQNYTLSFNYIPLVPLTLGLLSEDYNNYNDSVLSHVDTSTRNKITTASTQVAPPFLPQLTLTADYNRKDTFNLKTNDTRPKIVVNGKASYQVTTWGSIAYDTSIERNQGEVQAGSIVDLNYKKTTSTISLNLTLPVDNPVLNNFLVVASLKRVEYKNYYNSSDDFNASLLSFEGTLNF